MKKISKKAIWISIVIAFVIAVALIFICPYTTGVWTKVVIVCLAIAFIYLTIAVQVASFKTFKVKAKKEVYPTKNFKGNYNELITNLKQAGYKERKTNYGSSFLKVKQNVAYKCVIVEDFNQYFTPKEEPENNTSNKELEKCKIFVGIEIFKEIDEDNLAKLPDFSLQGKNIYYTALLNQEENRLVCLNFIEPLEQFQKAFDNILNDIKISFIENE